MSVSLEGKTRLILKSLIRMLPLDEREKPEKPRPFVQTRFEEGAAVFSPDGRWLAYMSNETGRNEMYARAVGEAAGRWQVSTVGGNEPVWPRHAHELFYRSGDVMMAVDVATTPTFAAGKPPTALRRPIRGEQGSTPQLRRDGRRAAIPDDQADQAIAGPSPDHQLEC